MLGTSGVRERHQLAPSDMNPPVRLGLGVQEEMAEAADAAHDAAAGARAAESVPVEEIEGGGEEEEEYEELPVTHGENVTFKRRKFQAHAAPVRR